jgi:hypothetical protein
VADLREGLIEALADRTQDLHAAADRYTDQATQLRDRLVGGVPLVDVFDQTALRALAEARHSLEKAFSAYLEAAGAGRAAVIRALIEEGAMSISAVARRLGISRQMTTRLYRPTSTVSNEPPQATLS